MRFSVGRAKDIFVEPAGVAGGTRLHLSGIRRGVYLGIVLILVVFLLVFYLATRPDTHTKTTIRPETRQGFHSSAISEGLSLKETARNWKYYRMMTSVCHRAGYQGSSAAYAYLFYSANRYSLSGKWSAEQFDAAVDASEEYYEVEPDIDCRADAANLHGIDADEDIWLMTRALNYVFYRDKVPVCEEAGNKVQARTYTYLADSERAKLKNHRWTSIEVNEAISSARKSPDLHRISGC